MCMIEFAHPFLPTFYSSTSLPSKCLLLFFIFIFCGDLVCFIRVVYGHMVRVCLQGDLISHYANEGMLPFHLINHSLLYRS